MKKTICFDFSNMSSVDISPELTDCGHVCAALEEKRTQHGWRMPNIRCCTDPAELLREADHINKNFESFVVIGIGGSTMGSHAIFTALKHLRYNDLPENRRGVRFYIIDNSDPNAIIALLDVVDPEKTMFNIITKSGNTVETLAHFMFVTNILHERMGDAMRKNIIVTTNGIGGILKYAADTCGFKTYIIPENIGGRFSVLTAVGLLPAAVLGVDISEMLDGAEAMDALSSSSDPQKNPALMYAALCCASMRKGMAINVFMPYSDSLTGVSDWFSQLWAESLGKLKDNNGNIVHIGQTPLRAVGATDQHSQFQLFIEGPFDKNITFLEVEDFGTTVSLPRPPIDIPELDYLCGQSFNDLIHAELAATAYALTKANKPNMRISISHLNAYTLGALFMFFEIATAFAAEFLNINAFDQPGVEESKVANFALMGKDGYEEKAKEISAFLAENPRSIYQF